MTLFKVCLSNSSHEDVATESERRKQSTSIAERQLPITTANVKRFVNTVGQMGYPFCPATFTEPHCRKDIFEQTQLFALSFNRQSRYNQKYNPQLSFEDIKRRAKRYNLPMLFAYNMYTWFANEQQFCIVFLSEFPIRDYSEAEIIQRALLKIFPEADRTHCSVIDLYFGGNEVLYYDEALPSIDPDIVLMNMCLSMKNQHGPTNYKMFIQKFAEETGLSLNCRGLPEVSFSYESAEVTRDLVVDENRSNTHKENPSEDSLFQKYKNSPNSIMYRLGNGEKLYFSINVKDETQEEDQKSSTREHSIHQLYRSNALNSVAFNCKLYDEFESGNRQLNDNELLGIATNLSRIEAGGKRLVSILKSNSYCVGASNLIEDWIFKLSYLKDRQPYPCSHFCPYHRECQHGKTILSTIKVGYHQIERVADYSDQLVSLDEAVKDFEKVLLKTVLSTQNKIFVIKSQTSLGKTETIIRYISKHPELNVLVVVPTNKLKREVYSRALEAGILLNISPSLHELEDELSPDVWDEIESLLDEGKSPMPYIQNVIKTNEDKRSVKIFEKYISDRNSFYESNGSAISTHRRLESIDVSKYDFVIIDEDYIYSTVIPNRETVPLWILKRIIKKRKLPKTSLLASKIKRILKRTKHGEDYFVLDRIDCDKSYYALNAGINISALCDATHFCYRKASSEKGEAEDSVTFTHTTTLQDSTKYIVLSATADGDIYKYYFGEDNVEFYECMEAGLNGEVVQYYNRPMSRSYIDRHPEVLGQITERTGARHNITFKKYGQYETDGMHFGNCAGCDSLKGEDINVIGTPHQPEWVYKLFAFAMGVNDLDAKLKQITVTHNGYRFRFSTYEDEVLRKIQFYMIESELEQAVGRARPLRCDCKVNLFSNFPLKQAVLKEFDYKEKEASTAHSPEGLQAVDK